MDYDIYHDESKEAGYWHGVLLVPRDSRQKVLEYLATIRKGTRFNRPLSFKDVKCPGARFQCCRAAVQLAVFAMIQDMKGSAENVLIGSRCYDRTTGRQATDYRAVVTIREAMRLKFIVFRERDAHKFLDPDGDFLDYGAKVETTMRMGLKGGLHMMFDENNPVAICSIHLDGHQHYRRHVDINRLIGRLKMGLRDYCTIADDISVDDRSYDQREVDGARSYDDWQFLQLTDLLIGSFRTVLADKKNEFQDQVAEPVKMLVDKWKAGRRRMESSRWYRGFCISQCYLDGGSWKFETLPSKENPYQRTLAL